MYRAHGLNNLKSCVFLSNFRYSSGIFDEPTCPTDDQHNHAVINVGYEWEVIVKISNTRVFLDHTYILYFRITGLSAILGVRIGEKKDTSELSWVKICVMLSIGLGSQFFEIQNF